MVSSLRNMGIIIINSYYKLMIVKIPFPVPMKVLQEYRTNERNKQAANWTSYMRCWTSS